MLVVYCFVDVMILFEERNDSILSVFVIVFMVAVGISHSFGDSHTWAFSTSVINVFFNRVNSCGLKLQIVYFHFRTIQ